MGDNTTNVPLQKLPTARMSGECTVFSAESCKVCSFVLALSEACVLMLMKNNRGSNAEIQTSFSDTLVCVFIMITSSTKHILCDSWSSSVLFQHHHDEVRVEWKRGERLFSAHMQKNVNKKLISGFVQSVEN